MVSAARKVLLNLVIAVVLCYGSAKAIVVGVDAVAAASPQAGLLPFIRPIGAGLKTLFEPATDAAIGHPECPLRSTYWGVLTGGRCVGYISGLPDIPHRIITSTMFVLFMLQLQRLSFCPRSKRAEELLVTVVAFGFLVIKSMAFT